MWQQLLSSLEQASVAHDVLSDELNLGTPRPVRISLQTSSDLASWSPNASHQQQRSADSRLWKVQTDAEGSKKFMRALPERPSRKLPLFRDNWQGARLLQSGGLKMDQGACVGSASFKVRCARSVSTNPTRRYAAKAAGLSVPVST